MCVCCTYILNLKQQYWLIKLANKFAIIYIPVHSKYWCLSTIDIYIIDDDYIINNWWPHQQQQQKKLTGGLGFRGFCFCCLALCLLDYLYSNYLIDKDRFFAFFISANDYFAIFYKSFYNVGLWCASYV